MSYLQQQNTASPNGNQTISTHPLTASHCSVLFFHPSQDSHSYINTGVTLDCRREPVAQGWGAQHHLKTTTTLAVVTKLQFKNRQILIGYDSESHREDARVLYANIFKATTPASSLTIQSKHVQTLAKFISAAHDLAQWLKNVKQITLIGQLSTDTLSVLAQALQNVEVFLLYPKSIVGERLTMDEFLKYLPNATNISLDSTFFFGSTLYNDTQSMSKWMVEKKKEKRSVQLFTQNCPGPHPLKFFIDNTLPKLSDRNTLTVVTASPLYKPIYSLLVHQLHFDVGPSFYSVHYNEEIYATFSRQTEEYTFNIGFSRPSEPF